MMISQQQRQLLLVALLQLTTLIVVVAASASTSSSSRQEIAFNFGWNHRTGLKEWAGPDDLPPKPPHNQVGFEPPESQPDYDDSDWYRNIQLPHDALIVNSPSRKACPINGCSGRSFIPRHVLWYRKTFHLPKEWTDNADSSDSGSGGASIISLQFDGSFRNTTVWFNGQLVQRHVCGYTPFRVTLTPELIRLGSHQHKQQQQQQQQQHTIAIFVDPDNGDEASSHSGSGWWYEGGGLYRNVRLIRTNPIHIVPNSLVVKSSIRKPPNRHSAIDLQAHLQMQAIVSIPPASGRRGTSKSGSNEEEKFCYYFEIQQKATKATITTTRSVVQSLPSLQEPKIQTIKSAIDLMEPQFWTPASPHLYQIDAVLSTDCPGAAEKKTTNALETTTSFSSTDKGELDRVSTYHGIRTIQFDPNTGFYLNDKPFKMRGFCDHDTFAVVGMAIPDRINLFRAQASRSIGGNGRRTSHNPPDPTLLDIYDRLGMVVIDENRLFGNKTEYVDNMGDLVQRDRNHPSVVIWSFCNEGGCEGDHEAAGPAFQNRTKSYDDTRPTLANMFTFNDLLSDTIDIQGFSHKSREHLDKCHSKLPKKPIVMSECCSCNTFRGQDEGCETTRDNPHYPCPQKAFNANCLQQLVNASDGVDYAAGTYVWTLFDYYGEPPSPGLHVSSTYGQFDLCGFPKSAAFWFRTQWLLGVNDDRMDKPYPTNSHSEVHIVESWESPDSWNYTRGNKTRTIHAYSDAPLIELYSNGKSQGQRTVVPMVEGTEGSYAQWTDVLWEAGTITAIAKHKNGTQLTKTSVRTNGAATAVVLSLDCPSIDTGTGEAVFLDGQDVALVRATIVDSNGDVVRLGNQNVTFSIMSGPGRIQGTANGDPGSYQPHTSSWQTAFHGLVRAVVRVTSTAGLNAQEMELLRLIDGPSSASAATHDMSDTDDIVIEATSPGLMPAQLRIPTSTDASASVLAVAEAFAGKPVNFFEQNSAVESRGLPTVESLHPETAMA